MPDGHRQLSDVVGAAALDGEVSMQYCCRVNGSEVMAMSNGSAIAAERRRQRALEEAQRFAPILSECFLCCDGDLKATAWMMRELNTGKEGDLRRPHKASSAYGATGTWNEMRVARMLDRAGVLDDLRQRLAAQRQRQQDEARRRVRGILDRE
jgi:hypothetical protein